MRTDGSRADATENRARLVDAVGRLLAREGSVGLSDLAVEAGVSRSTTYRNFSTADAAVVAYIDDFLAAFEREIDETDSLQTVSEVWGRLVAERSQALIHVRSTEGFLARVRRADPLIIRVDQVVRRAVRSDPERELSDQDLDLAVFLWNSLLDPRELLDLAQHLDITVQEATAIMLEHVEVSLHHLGS